MGRAIGCSDRYTKRLPEAKESMFDELVQVLASPSRGRAPTETVGYDSIGHGIARLCGFASEPEGSR